MNSRVDTNNTKNIFNLASLKAQLSSLEAQLKEVDKLIEKLEGLPAADASAFAGIDGISFGSGITV